MPGDGLVALWDFQSTRSAPGDNGGPEGQKFTSIEGNSLPLLSHNGPIDRSSDGPLGGCLEFRWGQWLSIETRDAPMLDLHGPDQSLSMIAWVQRRSDRHWQFIAGIWDEGTEAFKGQSGGTGPGAPARQYGMFINGAWQTDHVTYRRTRSRSAVLGYVSPGGGATPGHPFAFDYATGGSQLEKDRWYMIAYTFDGEQLRVYLDGRLDANGHHNPFAYDGPIHDGDARFTVAMRRAPKWPTYPEGVPNNTAGFDGRLAGLAVYNRALTDLEIANIHERTVR